MLRNMFLLLTLTLWFECARAQWDVLDIQILGEGCEIANPQIDESKLTLKFKRFVAALNSDTFATSRESSCSASLRFKVPAQTRLASLTHRVFAYAHKNEKTSMALDVKISLAGHPFAFRGSLPSGSSFDGLLLLYKSFDAKQFFDCSQMEEIVDVQMEWKLKVEGLAPGAHASLSLSGDQLWIDSWITTEACSSAGTFAGRDNSIW